MAYKREANEDAVCPNLDSWEGSKKAMRIGIVVNRGMRGNGDVPTARKDLSWAARNGAGVLNRNDPGSLEVGKKADLSVIRLDRPHLVPLLDLVSSLVHYAQASDVESVMVDGDWVMKDGGSSQWTRTL